LKDAATMWLLPTAAAMAILYALYLAGALLSFVSTR
jgi:hypothetical protein